MFDSFPKIALLGRPNVGKSTLFNRLIRSNRAITHDRPGVTRDRMEGIVRVKGEHCYAIIDTGGVTLSGDARISEGPEALRGFEHALLEQAKDAMQDAVALCLVVDAKDGLTPFDRHLADYLRKSGKPLLLVVNKVDGPDRADLLMAEFHELGIPMLPCSASHGYNVRELEARLYAFVRGQEPETREAPTLPETMLGATKRQRKRMLADASMPGQVKEDSAQYGENLPEEGTEIPGEQYLDAEGEEGFALPLEGAEGAEGAEALSGDMAGGADEEVMFSGEGALRLALLGRPNAGKSSLVNAMSGQNRMIVSDIAGTTRDSVDVEAEIDGEPCVFVDTAGVRRPSRITDTVERYSVNASIKSTTKAHVTLLLLDAEEGLTAQDKRLIDLLNERKTPFMVLVNKVDLVAPPRRKEMEEDFAHALAFCGHVPLLFISALKKRGLKKIVSNARKIRSECAVRISTGQLNRAMKTVLERHQPPVVNRARAKFFYLTQAESSPPTFVFFVNSAERVLPSYARYLEKSLRKLFGIQHAPMRIHFRSSHSKK